MNCGSSKIKTDIDYIFSIATLLSIGDIRLTDIFIKKGQDYVDANWRAHNIQQTLEKRK